MTYPKVAQVSVFCLAAERVSQTKVGVPNHPPDLSNSPVDQALCHEVADRVDVSLFILKSYIYPIIANFNWVNFDTVIETWCLPGERVVVPAMPRAPQEAVLDRALSERSSLMGTAIIKGSILTLVVSDTESLMLKSNRFNSTLWEFTVIQYFEPRYRFFWGHFQPLLLIAFAALLDHRYFEVR